MRCFVLLLCMLNVRKSTRIWTRKRQEIESPFRSFWNGGKRELLDFRQRQRQIKHSNLLMSERERKKNFKKNLPFPPTLFALNKGLHFCKKKTFRCSFAPPLSPSPLPPYFWALSPWEKWRLPSRNKEWLWLVPRKKFCRESLIAALIGCLKHARRTSRKFGRKKVRQLFFFDMVSRMRDSSH